MARLFLLMAIVLVAPAVAAKAALRRSGSGAKWGGHPGGWSGRFISVYSDPEKEYGGALVQNAQSGVSTAGLDASEYAAEDPGLDDSDRFVDHTSPEADPADLSSERNPYADMQAHSDSDSDSGSDMAELEAHSASDSD